jgi:hypothetical protein
VTPDKQEQQKESKKREKKSSNSKTQATPNWDKYYEIVDFKGQGGPPQQFDPQLPVLWQHTSYPA